MEPTYHLISCKSGKVEVKIHDASIKQIKSDDLIKEFMLILTKCQADNVKEL